MASRYPRPSRFRGLPPQLQRLRSTLSGSRLPTCLLVVLGLVALVLPAQPAPAASQVEVQAQIDKLGAQIAALDEQYNQATIRLQKVESQITDSRASSTRAQSDFKALQKVASAQAATVYRAGSPSMLAAFLTAKSLEDFNQKMQLVSQVNHWESGIMTGLQIADQRAKFATETLNQRLDEAKVLNTGLARQRSSLQSQLGQQQVLLAQINEATRLAAAKAAQERADAARAELARADAARATQAQADAARAALLRAATAAASSPSQAGVVLPPVVPAAPSTPASSGGSSRGAIALRVAMAQIGKPYVWAGSGPDVFDCSGLMLYSYRAAGIYLSHSAADQFASFPHVSRDQLQPGDIVFFGSPIHHDGMYIGGGMMVDAPETGDVVHVQSMMRSDYVGASRPG